MENKTGSGEKNSGSFLPTEKEIRQARRYDLAPESSRAAKRGQLTRRAYRYEDLRDQAMTTARSVDSDEAEVQRAASAARQFNRHYLRTKKLARLYV